MPVYMILFKRNKYANQSYTSFYKSNNHIKLWITDMKSSDSIRQRRTIYAYCKEQTRSSCTMIILFNPDILHNYEYVSINMT